MRTTDCCQSRMTANMIPSKALGEPTKELVCFENVSDDMDEKSDDSLLDGSDAENDGSSSQEATKHSDNQVWLFQSAENEVFFGGNKTREYSHEPEGEMDGSAELWIEMKKHDGAYIQVDFPIGMDEDNGVEHAGLYGGPEADCSSGNILEVRVTGRPDLDDAGFDFGMAREGFNPQPLRNIFLDGCRNCGSGRPDSETDIFLDDRVAQQNHIQGPCRAGSGIRRVLREDRHDIPFESHWQTDEHDQDEVQVLFAKRLSQHEDAKVAMESDLQKDGKISGESENLQVTFRSRSQCVQLPEMFTTKSSSGMKFQASDEDKGMGAGVLCGSNFKPAKNLEGSVHTKMHGLSHEAPEEDCDQVDTSSGITRDVLRKRGCIVRLGSTEAEELLQMDVPKMGRGLYVHLEPSSKRSTTPTHDRASVDWAAEDLGPDELSRYVEALEVKETYIDTVLDMEDILFDVEEGTGARILQGGKIMSARGDRPVRDGSVNASTPSEPTLVLRQPRQPPRNLNEVDWVEVVGALQRRGGTSLGDRVVGVKEHTIYRIKVNGGGYDWEIHRRYRDFVGLYNQLLQLFAHKGNIQLPNPWTKVNAESRKFFRNTSPGVVEVRSALIQVCLQSVLQAGPPLSAAVPFLRFLLPDRAVSHFIEAGQQGSGESGAECQSKSHVLSDDANSQLVSSLSDPLTSKAKQDQRDGGHTSVFGKTIRLVIQIHKKKSLKQQLQAQHHTCAGCYKHLELALGLVPELVQNWGWTGPRFCEYSGQIFCSTCHLNDRVVIPAWVLQRWDFAPRNVSQLAKAYLDSIYDKPMLCVSAVNPYLYARVPVLALLTDVRRNLSKMLACIRCPAHARIQAMMGSRRYLLESNDFFALRDLVDISKGAFAVLPGYMQALLLKLSVHITRECSACRELGETCGAGELCDGPFDVIYPYQDKGIARCQSCHSPYHRRCFLKCNNCCSWRTGQSCEMLEEPSYNCDLSNTHLNS